MKRFVISHFCFLGVLGFGCSARDEQSLRQAATCRPENGYVTTFDAPLPKGESTHQYAWDENANLYLTRASFYFEVLGSLEPRVGSETYPDPTNFDELAAKFPKGMKACFQFARDANLEMPMNTTSTEFNLSDEYSQRLGRATWEVFVPESGIPFPPETLAKGEDARFLEIRFDGAIPYRWMRNQRGNDFSGTGAMKLWLDPKGAHARAIYEPTWFNQGYNNRYNQMLYRLHSKKDDKPRSLPGESLVFDDVTRTFFETLSTARIQLKQNELRDQSGIPMQDWPLGTRKTRILYDYDLVGRYDAIAPRRVTIRSETQMFTQMQYGYRLQSAFMSFGYPTIVAPVRIVSEVEYAF